MKIDCPHCAGLGIVLVSGKGSIACSYCQGLGSLGLVVNTKKDTVICHICGKQIYDNPYQFLVKYIEDKIMYAHYYQNPDGLYCKKKMCMCISQTGKSGITHVPL